MTNKQIYRNSVLLKIMKKIIILSLVLLTFTAVTTSVRAVNLNNSTGTESASERDLATGNSASSVSAAKKQQNLTNRQTDLKNRAGQEIDRRISALNLLISRLNTMKKLTSDQKTSFVGQIQTEISNLTALKAKIVADTDITILRADIQSIIKSYRIYVVFVPQIHLLGAADVINTTAANFTTIIAKLQTRIDQAKTSGKDTTTMQAAIADMQKKITDAQTQAAAIQAAVATLTPDGYPANKTAISNARGLVKTASADLKAARDDAKTIIQALKGIGNTGVGGSSSVISTTPTTKPTPTGIASSQP
jgi:hypothetical protein